MLDFKWYEWIIWFVAFFGSLGLFAYFLFDCFKKEFNSETKRDTIEENKETKND